MPEPEPTSEERPERPRREPAPPNALRYGGSVWLREEDVQLSYARSSGPGGQSVNKLNTRAQLRVSVGAFHNMHEEAAARLRDLAGNRLTNADEILIDCDTSRSQRANRDECLDRLREMVLRALVRPRVSKKRGIPRGVKERRLQPKRENSEKKQRRKWRRD